MQGTPLVIFNFYMVFGSTLWDANILQKDLLHDYNKNVRPEEDQLVPVEVNMTLYLVSIQQFDEINGKFSVGGFLDITWYDSRMSWDLEEYNYTSSTLFSQDSVWKPPLLTLSSFGKVDEIGKDFMTIRYDYEGTAYWSPGDIFNTHCEVDVTYFPFDTQTCSISLTSWRTFSDEVLLKPTYNEVQLDLFLPHGTWEILSTHVDAYEIPVLELSRIDFKITMKRHPSYMVVNIVIPVFVLMALNGCVFLVPVETGERVSYSITVLLSTTVFMTLMSNNVPKTSEPMSLLSYVLIANLITSAIICLVTILGLRLHFKDDGHSVPPYLMCLMCRSRCRQHGHNDVYPLSSDILQNDIYVPNSKIQNCNEKSTGEIKRNEIKTENVSWKNISQRLDIIWFVISCLGLIVGLVLFCVIMVK